MVNNNFSWMEKEKWENRDFIYPKDDFVDNINKVEFISRTKDLILNDTFVYPRLSLVSKDWVEDEIDSDVETFLNSPTKISFVKWIELSWKTSLWRKIF